MFVRKKRRINELALATGPDFSIIVKKKKRTSMTVVIYACQFEKIVDQLPS